MKISNCSISKSQESLKAMKRTAGEEMRNESRTSGCINGVFSSFAANDRSLRSECM
jgi:hypothetical protein